MFDGNGSQFNRRVSLPEALVHPHVAGQEQAPVLVMGGGEAGGARDSQYPSVDAYVVASIRI